MDQEIAYDQLKTSEGTLKIDSTIEPTPKRMKTGEEKLSCKTETESDCLAKSEGIQGANCYQVPSSVSENDGDSDKKKDGVEENKPTVLPQKKGESQDDERKKMQILVSNFSEDQLNRYEMYRRAALPKASIRKVMSTITGSVPSQNVLVAMSGIAKVFVGELVEEAIEVMEKWGEKPPILPKHLREASRLLKQKQITNINTNHKKRMFV
ncbi:unnamed protein product [Owenia fusiformis]|uniref:Transcription initiation factor TFIID subunit 11 n=1 Tax=Owenia fusiformis TaxID=6347 RepID=A0A8S4NVF6_OWEFU|nr:unnamed protein product [Owenia fusiformis]